MVSESDLVFVPSNAAGSNAQRVGWIASCLLALLAACNSAHTDASTETGNPPVIDLGKIGLIMDERGTRLVGHPGAVKPGGVMIELTVPGSDITARGTAERDGSFEIPIEAMSDSVIEVRAIDGEEETSVIYTRGASGMAGSSGAAGRAGGGGTAAHGGGRSGAGTGSSGDGSTLSCRERTNQASQALAQVIGKPDVGDCMTASDCVYEPFVTDCTDTCGPALVARQSVAAIRAAVQAANAGICSSFAADGCSVEAMPCIPPPIGPVECVESRCQQLTMPRPRTCPTCFNRSLKWGPASGQITYGISGCDDFTRLEQNAPAACIGTVTHCMANSFTSDTLEDLIAALEDPAVKAAFAAGGPVGPPIPGGASLRVDLDGQTIVIPPPCGSPNCEPVAAGIATLRELLNRIPERVMCRPQAMQPEMPACPPNAVWIEDVCVQCGFTGGCGKREARCAVVCNDSGPCSDLAGLPGANCSARRICEVSACI